ncbi:hypothetical protein [Seinonella peptonophila]|nr:hypothetical protein [Seinonella peptonophila]
MKLQIYFRYERKQKLVTPIYADRLFRKQPSIAHLRLLKLALLPN